MSSVFSAYGKYYDLLYRDKDYPSEADYIHQLIQRHRPGSKDVLELGSGTGKHARLLARKGCFVHGVERSPEMLARATESPSADHVQFSQGDLREARVGRTFDAVISLFHVFSYQTSNADLLRGFETARIHLVPGGLFVFDCWYGPAVLTDRPAVRVKRMEDDVIRVIRTAEPELHPNENVVDVHYSVLIQMKGEQGVEEVEEVHSMRYLFLPEIRMMLEHARFELVHSEEWMTGRALGFDTWGACLVARAI